MLNSWISRWPRKFLFATQSTLQIKQKFRFTQYHLVFYIFHNQENFPPNKHHAAHKSCESFINSKKNHWLKPQGGKAKHFWKQKIQLTSNTPSLKWDPGSDPTLPTLGLWIISWRPETKPLGGYTVYQRSQGLDERLGNQFCIKSSGDNFFKWFCLFGISENLNLIIISYMKVVWKTHRTSSPRFWDDTIQDVNEN